MSCARRKDSMHIRSHLTFRDARNSMALVTWNAALTRSVNVNCLSGSVVGTCHLDWYSSLLFRKN